MPTFMEAAVGKNVLEAHEQHHALLEELLYELLEDIVAGRGLAARTRCAVFAQQLAAAIAIEDGEVLPAYRTLAAPEGPGRPEHVEGDHVILNRRLQALQEAVGALPEEIPLRFALTSVVPLVYPLLATLEHHLERERRFVYPLVVAALCEADREDLARALQALIADARAS